MPRALLISLRDPNDAMAMHERECFAERSALALEDVEVHPMVQGRPSVAQLRSFDAIFFGGSGAYSVLDDVPWIRDGIELCLEVVGLRIPAYASCFGFQGLALSLGGEVVRDAARTELGATPLALTEAGEQDSLFRQLPRRFFAQEGHHDHVERVPPGVTLLATGDISRNQAFRVDGAPFWASQFHPELTARTTTARFRYYMDHYLEEPGRAQEILHHLETGADSSELGGLLARLVRHEF
jgi:GMP synthase (glutamine-hydrolysing)